MQGLWGVFQKQISVQGSSTLLSIVVCQNPGVDFLDPFSGSEFWLTQPGIDFTLVWKDHGKTPRKALQQRCTSLTATV